MTYITQETSVKLAKEAMGDYSNDEHWRAFTEELQAFANAAIAHFLQQMGEWLPEPVKSVRGKMTDGWTCSVEATVDYYTREQMISYGMAQREKALEEAQSIISKALNEEPEIYTRAFVLAISAHIFALKGKQ